jgi:hypothetical protein
MDEYKLIDQVGARVGRIAGFRLTCPCVCCIYMCFGLQVKEDLCYVSADFTSELKNTKTSALRTNTAAQDPFGGSLKRSFVLPDFQTVMRGFVKPETAPIVDTEQVLHFAIAQSFRMFLRMACPCSC